MTKLVVVATGPITSIQDTGRAGAQRYGLPPSGVMDPLAMAAANVLVENVLSAPVIEIGPLPATFRIEGSPVRIAFAGTGRKVEIGGRTLEVNESGLVANGESISIGFARGGIFSYLGLAGGIRGEPVFGSFSVTAGTGIGSPVPRALQAGDEIELNVSSAGSDHRIDLPASKQDIIRVVAGPQADEFGDNFKHFIDSEWQITPASDRMGYRLKGPRISHSRGHNIVSDGTVNGSIQVPGDGQPIVLMPDRGTTGGYPKIATVITPDLAVLAQMQAGRTFRFSQICIDEAQGITRDYYRLLESLPTQMRLISTLQTNIGALLDANIAGAAINALDTQTWQVPSPENRNPDENS